MEERKKKMTSKEALEQLLYYATLDDSGFEPHMKEYANIIEKDLLLLDLIKKTCDICVREVQGTYYLFIGNNIRGAKPLTQDQVEILGVNYETKRMENEKSRKSNFISRRN